MTQSVSFSPSCVSFSPLMLCRWRQVPKARKKNKEEVRHQDFVSKKFSKEIQKFLN